MIQGTLPPKIGASCETRFKSNSVMVFPDMHLTNINKHIKMNKKVIKVIGIIVAIIVIIVFLDFALGGFLTGWNNPK